MQWNENKTKWTFTDLESRLLVRMWSSEKVRENGSTIILSIEGGHERTLRAQAKVCWSIW